MKKNIAILILFLSFENLFANGFSLVGRDVFNVNGAYHKKVDKKITVYATFDRAYLSIYPHYLEKNEYAVVKNQKDTTYIKSVSKDFKITQDSTKFTIEHNSEVLYEVLFVIKPAQELYNLTYISSLGNKIAANGFSSWNEKNIHVNDPIFINNNYFDDKYFSFEMKLKLLNDSIFNCNYNKNHQLYVNGLVKYSFENSEKKKYS